ncbi:MAG: ABC transporter permease [Acidimicrobiaceae bacterium]|nr:ABC transporter permease [Acidimicrobiaceae bacterium]
MPWIEFRLEKRLEPPRWLGPSMPFVAVTAALLLGAAILLVSGRNPAVIYQRMFQAAFTNPGALSATLAAATPLLLTGLAAAVAFRMRVWNIGADGQLMIAAVLAAGAGIALGERSLAISLPAMLVAGAIGGVAWALIPALLRAYLRTSEVLTTLMLNYVAPLLLFYLIIDSTSYWRDLESPSARVFPQGKTLAESDFWPEYGEGIAVPFGLVVGVVLAVVLAVVLRSTRLGFQMKVAADSETAGHYAGIRTVRLLILVMVISGALAGLAGASQVGDFSHRIEPKALQFASYGYTGIAVAALARYNPLGVVLSAFLVGGMTNAGFAIQGVDLPLGLIGLIQGLILLLVAASEVSSRYRFVFGRRAKLEPRGPGPPRETGETAAAGAGEGGTS